MGPEEVSERNLHSPDLLALARRVEVVIDPALDALYPAKTAARVTVASHRGAWEAYVEDPLGGRENPLSREGLLAKYHSLVDPVAGRANAERIRDAVLALPGAGTTAALGQLLRF